MSDSGGSLSVSRSLLQGAARSIPAVVKHEEPEDVQYVLRVIRGDTDAFSQLVRRYEDRVIRFQLRMTGCRETALDLAQETFLRAFQALASWQPSAQFRTWLFRIASNAAIDHLRRNRQFNHVPLEENDEFGCEISVERLLSADQQMRILAKAVAQLPKKYSEALLLRELEGMSYSEIALLLDVSEGTVKSRISRARHGILSHFGRAV